MINLWQKIKENFPTTLFLSVFAWFFGLYSGYQVELREERKAQNLNDQRIVEGYFNIIREVRLSEDYQQSESEENNVIHNLTLITLRELNTGSDRKAAIVLLLNKLQIPENFAKNYQNFAFYKGADLKFTDFTGYDFRDANLSKADLRGAIFHKTELQNSQLNWANLTCDNKPQNGTWGWIPFMQREVKKKQCAVLTNVNLEKANLSFAKLSNADLSDADLTNANLSDADLTGTKLAGINFEGAILNNTKFGNNFGLSEAIKQDLIRRGAIFSD